MDLQEYERVKFELADLLRSVSAETRSSDAAISNTIRDLFGRLAEDRFNLVVVGRFSRGKTSLMNAILGADRLPTGVIPLTSVITTVSYGSDERAVLFYKNTELFMDVALADLAHHITERGNPGNAKGIRMAEVQLPSDILRRGFYFVDTPGLGSSIAENTRTTEGFLPEADAFILVTSYDSALSEEERRILEMTSISGRRVFVVLNKKDAVPVEEREDVETHLHAQLQAIFGDAVPALYSVSAQQGLHARQCGDEAALEASGIPALEIALIDFLVNEQRQEFLINACGRLEDIMDGTRSDGPQRFRLQTVRNSLAAESLAARAAPLVRSASISPTLPGCEICRRVADDVFTFLARFQGQLRSDSGSQEDLAARGGLCASHTRQFEALAAPREVCTGFAPALDQHARRLRRLAGRAIAPNLLAGAVADLIPTEEDCQACHVAQTTMLSVVVETNRSIESGAEPSVDNVSAICLPHLACLLRELSQPAADALLLREAAVLERLAEDMRRFALKQDGVKRHLLSGEERAASRRALRMILRDANAETGWPVPVETRQPSRA